MMLICCIFQKFDWIASAAAIATLGAACGTFLTVKEIKKQRKATYRPDLSVNDIFTYVYGENVSGTLLPFKNSKEKIDKKNINNKNTLSGEISVEIRNLGFASAKALEYKWEFDIDKAINQIGEGYFEIINTNNKLLSVNVPSLNWSHGYPIKANLHGGTRNYVLPVSIEKEDTLLPIPMFYFPLAVIFIENYLKINLRGTSKKEEKSLVPFIFSDLILKFSYRDLDGEIYGKKIKFELNCPTYWGTPIEEDKEFGILILKATEIKTT